MRWPWSKTEKRDSGGNFSDAVVRLIESQAAGTAADASSTAAVEAASGALSRAFASADVRGEAWVQEIVTPSFLAQVGRDLIRNGDSMNAIQNLELHGNDPVDPGVKLALGRQSRSGFNVDGARDVHTGLRRRQPGIYRLTSVDIPALGFDAWSTLCRHRAAELGTHDRTTAKSETERSLADEAQAAALAQLLAIPQDGGDGGDDDPLAMMKGRHQAKARGKALLVETSSGRLGRRQNGRAGTRLES